MATVVHNDFTFDTGKWGAFAASVPTEASGSYLKAMTDHTAQVIYLEFVQMNCSSGANVSLYDGSKLLFGPLSCATGASVSQEWDFKRDPLKLRGVDTTLGLDVSAAAAGAYSAYAKGYWGSR